MVKRQNLRPHKRHVYASREPRAPDQSSIFTLKSCVAQALLITSLNIQTSTIKLSTAGCVRLSFPHPVDASLLSTLVRSRSGSLSVRTGPAGTHVQGALCPKGGSTLRYPIKRRKYRPRAFCFGIGFALFASSITILYHRHRERCMVRSHS